MSLGKPVVKDCFMDEEMKDFAISEAMKALDNSNSEKVRSYSSWSVNIDFIVGGFIHEVNILKKVQICLALYRW